jgi:hypothetical protein
MWELEEKKIKKNEKFVDLLEIEVDIKDGKA